MAIVVVGDRSVIEPGLRQLETVGQEIKFLDSEGQPLQTENSNR
jgi:hypothetical protein